MVQTTAPVVVVPDEAKDKRPQPSVGVCKSENVVSSGSCRDSSTVPTLVDGRFLLGDKIWHAPSHRKCVDVVNGDHFLCQVTTRITDVTKLHSFVAHIRLEGHSGVNPIHRIVVDSRSTYVLYRTWNTKKHRGPHDLQALLQTRRRLPESHCRQYFRQIATLVKEAHAQGIVLRDLKLRKFIFKDLAKRQVCLETLEDAVVLGMEPVTGNHFHPPVSRPSSSSSSCSTPFGAAPLSLSSSSSSSSSTDSESTEIDDMLTDRWRCVPYCPPEILNSRKDPYSGRQADLWSLGVILYTMLVGRYPFSAAKDPTVVSRIRRGTFTIPSHVSPEAASLLRALLQKEPETRLTAAQCLTHPWISRHRCRNRLCSNDAVRDDCCWETDAEAGIDPLTHSVPEDEDYIKRTVPVCQRKDDEDDGDNFFGSRNVDFASNLALGASRTGAGSNKPASREETTRRVDQFPSVGFQTVPDIY